MVTLSPFLISLVSLTSLVVTSPVVKIRSSGITIPIATRINATRSSNFVKQEQQRAKALIRRAKAQSVFKAGLSQDDGTDITVTNTAVIYTLQASIGFPGTDYTLIIDTGSSNTWIGANKKYTPTSSSKDTGTPVAVTYGSGFFSGEEYTDRVDLGGGLVIYQQSIGVANQSRGFTDVDGILGIGPIGLTKQTLPTGEEIPTVMDNLSKAGTIPANLIGIYYNTPTSTSDPNGELTFGGIDASKISGDITYVPITSTSPASEYWGIDQTITYGSSGKKILDTTAGIVDTGTTLMLLATDAFQRYSDAVGGTLDDQTGLLKVNDTSLLQSLYYKIGDTIFEFTAEGQQWPKALNSVIGGDANSTYLVIADLGFISGQGLDFINGYTWLEHFYSVFDTENEQVGIANLNDYAGSYWLR